MYIQQTQVRREVKVLRRARSIDNKIKRHFVRDIPVLVGSRQESISAHLLRIRLLRVRARDDPRLGTKRFREEEPEMSDSAHANDTNFLAWAGSVAHERAVRCEAGAEHRCCLVGCEACGDGEDPILTLSALP